MGGGISSKKYKVTFPLGIPNVTYVSDGVWNVQAGANEIDVDAGSFVFAYGMGDIQGTATEDGEGFSLQITDGIHLIFPNSDLSFLVIKTGGSN